jgi:hypothetical protein
LAYKVLNVSFIQRVWDYIKSNNDTIIFKIFARNFNILRVQNGMAGFAFGPC